MLVNAPEAIAPCNAPAAPPSLYIWTPININFDEKLQSTTYPNIFYVSSDIYLSIWSPILDDGEIGYINEFSENP